MTPVEQGAPGAASPGDRHPGRPRNGPSNADGSLDGAPAVGLKRLLRNPRNVQ
jgi:hypothetical protein